MTSDLGEELALRPLASKTKTKIEDQRCRASSGDPTITKLTSATLAPEVVRPAEAEDVLGLSASVISKCMTKRTALGE